MIQGDGRCAVAPGEILLFSVTNKSCLIGPGYRIVPDTVRQLVSFSVLLMLLPVLGGCFALLQLELAHEAGHIGVADSLHAVIDAVS